MGTGGKRKSLSPIYPLSNKIMAVSFVVMRKELIFNYFIH